SATGGVIAAAGHVADQTKEIVDQVLSTAHVPRSHEGEALGRLIAGAREFEHACRQIQQTHFEETEVVSGLERLIEFAQEIGEKGTRYSGAREKRETELPAHLRKT